MSILQRIWGIYTKPRETMEYLSQKPDWILPVVVVAVAVLLSGLILYPTVIRPQQVEQISKQFRENANIPPEQAQQMEERALRFTEGPFGLLTGIGGMVVFALLSILIPALVFFWLGQLLGGEGAFRNVLSIVSYASLVVVPGLIVRTPLMLAKHSVGVQTSLALVLSPEQEGSFLFRFLAQFDIFVIWQLILAALGLAILYRFSKQKAAALVFGLWLLWAILLTFLGGLTPMAT